MPNYTAKDIVAEDIDRLVKRGLKVGFSAAELRWLFGRALTLATGSTDHLGLGVFRETDIISPEINQKGASSG